ncbi:pyrroloquinoline quinone biosynthesis protein PqqB [Aureitalea marina]|uniref:Pyrroloquinoline quinone biosynthesis protein PqqB n=2 Tax=Aureitalea marina TaxID=930804 RepID=A0A2S7KTT0_9FLAO|nr:pyrroloquinoline quinone biosynthesis protein PqqB [Aureitalea marina]
MSNYTLIRSFLIALVLIIMNGCDQPREAESVSMPVGETPQVLPDDPFIVVLGTIQDAGSPQIGCNAACCRDLFADPDVERMRTSLGLIDPNSGRSYLFEATPDIGSQLHLLQKYSKLRSPLPDGIFLTHAHIGHYSGLQFLGKEAINATETRVYGMPRMIQYLNNNGPWEQLVTNNNIQLQPILSDSTLILSQNLTVTPLLVPHRDEYSETVGYMISGPEKTALFIPDIDKWDRWERSIVDLIKEVDIAFLDATFYHGDEIQVRDISQIPHPFIEESMELFKGLSAEDKSKVNFIHFNHTNPVLNLNSIQYQTVLGNGFSIAQLNDVTPL